jgi:hypothetical protein
MLAPGARLGPYEVIAPLGSGGMGEVYRARDTRLDRTVAVKVLPEAFSGDAALRQRLQTEARAISQLSHPHICTLHDIGEQDGAAFLVMELIEGETLADRLKGQAGRGLPIEEALRLGIQIADALAAAHRRGIVHRDLKPGNVMLTRAGTTGPGSRIAKLLDFGLAKLRQPPVAMRGASIMPTTPPIAVTSEGMLLGTYQYMSPEQLEGAEADARSDVFAAGCVLYEMLAGAPPFDGRSPAGIMAAILEREPVALATRQPAIPPLAAGIVERCLAKDPDSRWQSAADLAAALRLASQAIATPAATVERSAGLETMGWRAIVIGAGAVVAALAVGAALSRLFSSPVVAPAAETRFEVMPPPGTTWSPSPVASTVQLALSPDGRRLAFVAARRRDAPQLWIRELDSVQAQPLAGTDEASFPFWSYDSRFIAFFAGGKLKKIDTTGGAPQVLADAPLGRGGTWNQDDVILFAPSPPGGIWRVPAAGGVATPVTTPASAAINLVCLERSEADGGARDDQGRHVLRGRAGRAVRRRPARAHRAVSRRLRRQRGWPALPHERPRRAAGRVAADGGAELGGGAEAIEPQRPRGHGLCGWADAQSGQPREAVSEFRKALAHRAGPRPDWGDQR